MGLNKVILQGNLVADPECRVVPSGVSVCSFRIAVGRRFAKQGDEVTSDFFTVEAWRNTADFIGKHFIKGQQIIIVGAIQNRNRVDRNGVKRYGDVIIADEAYFCGVKDGGSSSDSPHPSAPHPSALLTPSPQSGEGLGTGEYNSAERVTPNFEEISGEDDLPF